MTAKLSAKATEPAKSQAGLSHITLYPAWCKRCGLCIAFCPKTVFDSGPEGGPVVARPEDCIRCHMCELRCPDFAISVAGKEES